MKSLFEEMGGTYTLGADGMYYPDLELPEEEPHYGKYGRMRLRYLLTLQMQEQQGINEALKARDQMAWVGACNNIRNAAEEIVLNELICC